MVCQDVFHIRLHNMEIQAERIIDPRLKTQAIAIISSNHSNGSIISLSSEAKEEGLCRGMKVSLVRKMSHRTQLLPYNQLLYDRINQYVYKTVSSFTPVVEPYMLNEFFLDMAGMDSIYNNIKNVGFSIIKRIKDQISIDGTIGISNNKLVSQIVTAVIPDVVHKINRGHESQFLAPLNPKFLPIVRIKSIQRILKFLLIKQISHIQVIAEQSEEFKILFGIYAKTLRREAKGHDTSKVKSYRYRNHILEQRILPEDTNDKMTLYAIVKDLSERISFKLRKRNQIADSVQLEIHYSDGYNSCYNGKFAEIDDISVFMTCKILFENANRRRNRIRSILIDASKFRPYSDQKNLFFTKEDHSVKVSQAIDIIRAKYGFNSIQTVNVLQTLNNH